MIVPEFADNKERFSKSKVLLSNPSLYHVLSGREGKLREALTVLVFRTSGYDIFASPKEESGDYIEPFNGRNISIEVGGKKKSFKQSDYVIRDNIDYPASGVIPLWAISMMWRSYMDDVM